MTKLRRPLLDECSNQSLSNPLEPCHSESPAVHRHLRSRPRSNSTVLCSSQISCQTCTLQYPRRSPCPSPRSVALSLLLYPRAKNTPFCVLLESCICAIAILRRSPDITVRGRCSAMRLWAVGRGGGLIQARTLTLTLVFFFFPSAVSTILRSGGARPDVLAPASPK